MASDNRVHFSTECELLDGKSSGYSPDFTIIDDIELNRRQYDNRRTNSSNDCF